MKVYVVGYYNCYDAYNLVGVFSSEDKANKFIENCKKPFYKDNSIVLHDYRSFSEDLYVEDWDLDEFNNIIDK